MDGERFPARDVHSGGVGGGGRGREGYWHKASVSDCLPLAAPIGLSPLLILTPCGSERVLVVSTEPPHDLSCLTTPGFGRPGDGAVARAIDQVHPDEHSESMRGFADSSKTGSGQWRTECSADQVGFFFLAEHEACCEAWAQDPRGSC